MQRHPPCTRPTLQSIAASPTTSASKKWLQTRRALAIVFPHIHSYLCDSIMLYGYFPSNPVHSSSSSSISSSSSSSSSPELSSTLISSKSSSSSSSSSCLFSFKYP